MSRLLAIDTKAMQGYRDLQLILSHIGQNKNFFLVNIPHSIDQELQNFARSNNLSDMQKIRIFELLKRLRNNSIIRFRNDNSSKDFVIKVANFYKKDQRLELAITNQNEPKPFKSLDNINFDELSEAKSLQLKPTDSYDKDDLDMIWNYLEFHLITAKKIALVGSYNFIFKPNSIKLTKSNLYYLLEKIFKEFKLRGGSRCEEFFIYAAPNEYEYSFIEKQKKAIEKFLNNLMQIYKIRFGIHYIVIRDRDIKNELHQRFLVTSYAAINMGSEFSESKKLSVMSPISDNEAIEKLQIKWLEEQWDKKGHLIIRSTYKANN